MNFNINTLVLVSFGASILCILIAGLYQHFVSHKYSHQRLLAELPTIPLAQMLHRLGIPLQLYSRKTGWEEIGSQVRTCKNCEQFEYCKQCFAKQECNLDLQTCPNYPSLRKLTS